MKRDPTPAKDVPSADSPTGVLEVPKAYLLAWLHLVDDSDILVDPGDSQLNLWSRNSLDSARLLNNPRTTTTEGPQVLKPRNRGKVSNIHDQEDASSVPSTKIHRTNTLL